MQYVQYDEDTYRGRPIQRIVAVCTPTSDLRKTNNYKYTGAGSWLMNWALASVESQRGHQLLLRVTCRYSIQIGRNDDIQTYKVVRS